jgi:2-oxoacid:acceptor oxidoreductase gamma subunit (pyruvate/2-ketoisovalerate family)
MICIAASYEGKYAQSSQGQTWDRRGTPMVGYARIDDQPINERGFIAEPNIVVVLADSLTRVVNVEAGMPDDGLILVNTARDLGLKHRSFAFDFTSLAMEKLGSPITNTVMLGTFAAATGLFSFESVDQGMREILGKKLSSQVIANNIAAVRAAYEEAQKCLSTSSVA